MAEQDDILFDESNQEGFEADIGASGFNDRLSSQLRAAPKRSAGRRLGGEEGASAPTTPTEDYVDSLERGSAPAPKPREFAHFTDPAERAALVAAAMAGDRSGLLTAMPEGQARALRGQYNPNRFRGVRRITPVSVQRSDKGEVTGVFEADVAGKGGRGYVPITADPETSLSAATESPSGVGAGIPFSAEDPPILRPLTRGGAISGGRVDRVIERHNIIAQALQDRNSKRIREALAARRPEDAGPRISGGGVRSGSQRFVRQDTGQEIVATDQAAARTTAGQTPVTEVTAQAKAQSAARREEAASRGKTLRYSATAGRELEVPILPPVQGPPAPTGPLGTPQRPYTEQQAANVAGQREILARQGAAQTSAQARREAGRAARAARQQEAAAARQQPAAELPVGPLADEVPESELPAPTLRVGGRTREQQAALVQASAAMRGRMPLVSTVDPEQVRTVARESAARLDALRRMTGDGPRRLEGGGRGPRSFIDPDAAAGKMGDLRDLPQTAVSDFAVGEDPEQIDVDLSNAVLGTWRREQESNAIIKDLMERDAEGRPLRESTVSSEVAPSVEREARAMTRQSRDPYAVPSVVFGRTPDVGRDRRVREGARIEIEGEVQPETQGIVIGDSQGASEGTLTRRDAMAAEARLIERGAARTARSEQRSQAQRAAELSRRERERAAGIGPVAGPSVPARQLPDNAVTSAGQQPRVETDVDEVTRRVQAGEDMQTVIKEIQIRKSRG